MYVQGFAPFVLIAHVDFDKAVSALPRTLVAFLENESALHQLSPRCGTTHPNLAIKPFLSFLDLLSP